MALQRRMIYAQLAENKGFASMSDKAQLLYIFMIVLADDEGRLKGDSELLRARVFPYNTKITVNDIKFYTQEIVKKGLIRWYKDDENNYFIEHPKWTKYQVLRPDRIRQSDIPPSNDGQVADKRPRKLIKLSKEKEVIHSLSYLKKIPEKDLEEFYNRFDASKKAIQAKAEDLVNWCEANGRVKKNYKAFLLTALRKDFPERKEPPRKIVIAKPEESKKDDKKEVGKPIPDDIKADIKKIIGDKTVK